MTSTVLTLNNHVSKPLPVKNATTSHSATIPQAFIEQLLKRINLVELIGQQITLKASSDEYRGLCPFHKETDPSFTVVPRKGFFHCFGCQVHGNAITFIMHYDGLGFRQAVAKLAEQVGLTLPASNDASNNSCPHVDNYQPLLAKAATYYQQQLHSHPKAQTARNYLAHRGINENMIKHFGIGYALPGWDNLIRTLAPDTDVETLVTAGLVTQRKDGQGYHDLFRQRLMFPIRDQQGYVLGFGSRIIGERGKPKYLNSSETTLFKKNQLLYGLFEALSQQRCPRQLIIVEGYLDVISLHQHGIHNVVALLGTAVSAAQLKQLFRHSERLLFCFDGDDGGLAAEWRTLKACLPFLFDGRQVNFRPIAPGYDPDSLIQGQGPRVFTEYMQKAQPLSATLFEALERGVDLQTLEGRSQYYLAVKALINRLPDGIFKALMSGQLDQRVGLPSANAPAMI